MMMVVSDRQVSSQVKCVCVCLAAQVLYYDNSLPASRQPSRWSSVPARHRQQFAAVDCVLNCSWWSKSALGLPSSLQSFHTTFYSHLHFPVSSQQVWNICLFVVVFTYRTTTTTASTTSFSFSAGELLLCCFIFSSTRIYRTSDSE